MSELAYFSQPWRRVRGKGNYKPHLKDGGFTLAQPPNSFRYSKSKADIPDDPSRAYIIPPCQKWSTQEQSPFFKLPPELRQMIYKYAIEDDCEPQPTKHSMPEGLPNRVVRQLSQRADRDEKFAKKLERLASGAITIQEGWSIEGYVAQLMGTVWGDVDVRESFRNRYPATNPDWTKPWMRVCCLMRNDVAYMCVGDTTWHIQSRAANVYFREWLDTLTLDAGYLRVTDLQFDGFGFSPSTSAANPTNGDIELIKKCPNLKWLSLLFKSEHLTDRAEDFVAKYALESILPLKHLKGFGLVYHDGHNGGPVEQEDIAKLIAAADLLFEKSKSFEQGCDFAVGHKWYYEGAAIDHEVYRAKHMPGSATMDSEGADSTMGDANVNMS